MRLDQNGHVKLDFNCFYKAVSYVHRMQKQKKDASKMSEFFVVDINGTITTIFNKLVQQIVNVLYGCK